MRISAKNLYSSIVSLLPVGAPRSYSLVSNLTLFMSRIDYCKGLSNGTQHLRAQEFDLYFPGSVYDSLAVRERVFGKLLHHSRPGGSVSERPVLPMFGRLY